MGVCHCNDAGGNLLQERIRERNNGDACVDNIWDAIIMEVACFTLTVALLHFF